MKHLDAAKRFYRAPSGAKKLLPLVQKQLPLVPANLQHAYAMHIYARQTNEVNYKYMNLHVLDIIQVMTIRKETLLKYLPFVDLKFGE